MFELHATGLYSISALTKIINNEGFRNKRGNPSGDAAIYSFLTSPFYYGVFKWQGRIFKGAHEPLVSKDIFDRVQVFLRRRQQAPQKQKVVVYNLNNLMTCGVCGCKVLGERKKAKYTYYHCTEYSGKHKTAWIREEDVTKQFREIISRIQIPEHIAEEITNTLRESHEGKKEYYEDIYEGLQAEHKRYESRLEKMYEHLLDGRLSEEEYDKKRKEYRAKQEEIQSKIASLRSADDSYYLTAKYILRLSQKASDLFESSEPVVKRQIIKLLLQNCEVNDVSLSPTYRSPFHMFAEGAIRQEWLPVSHP